MRKRGLFKEGFTDEQNAHDAFLLGYGIGLLGIMVLVGYGLWTGQPPKLLDFAQSLGWLTTGSGIGYGIKRAGEKLNVGSGSDVDSKELEAGSSSSSDSSTS